MQKALLYNLLSSFFSVLLIITIKVMVLEYIIVSEIASFFRHISALFVLFPLIILNLEKNPHHFVQKIPHGLMVIRALCYTFVTFCWPIVYTHIPLHIAMTIAFIVPFLSNFLLKYFLHEKIPRHVWVAKIIAFCGVIIILEPYIKNFNRYYVLAFFGAIVWAVTTVMNKEVANRKVRPSIGMCYHILYAVIFTTIIVFTLKVPMPSDCSKPIMVLGVISVLAQWFSIKSYRLSKGYYINAFEFLRFLMFLVCDAILFGAEISLITIAGSVVIGSSVVYIVKKYS